VSGYRQIHTRIWQDAWFMDLLPEEKLLFVYLFSNERASLCGMYELSLKTMSFETGLRVDAITLALHRFGEAGKVFYEAPHIWVPNLRKYNANRSPKVQAKIASELADLPECALKRRCVADDTTAPGVAGDMVSDVSYTVSSESRETRHEQEQEQQQEQEQKPSRPDGRTLPHDPLRKSLEVHFSAVTKLPPTRAITASQRKAAGRLWWAPLREIAELCEWDEEKAKRLISETVREMRNSRLTISDPNSILKPARARYAQLRPAPIPDFIPPNQRA
jgi:hypothetical protein